MLSECQEFGVSIEDEVICYFRLMGFRVFVPRYRLSSGADFFINSNYPVFVKASRRSFCRNGQRSFYSRYLVRFSNISNYVCGLIAVVLVTEANQHFLFVIPIEEIKKHQYLQVVSFPVDYRGWASKYFCGCI